MKLSIHFGRRALAHGTWDMDYGICAMGYGICAMGYEIWDMRYGIWVIECVTACGEVGHGVHETRLCLLRDCTLFACN